MNSKESTRTYLHRERQAGILNDSFKVFSEAFGMAAKVRRQSASQAAGRDWQLSGTV
jgi:hypothetical protein